MATKTPRRPRQTKADANSDLANAHELAFWVVGEAFELHFLAGRYAQATNPARRTELAEQFLDHLYALESDFQTLRKARLLFREMAAYADGRCKIGCHLEASAHSAVISLGLGIVAQCADVMLRRVLPDTWPPQTNEEYALPDKLLHRQLAAPHAAAVIENFQENLDEVLPLDQLNELSPRLEQEYASAAVAKKSKETIAELASSESQPQAAGAPKDEGDSGAPNVVHSADFRSVVWSGTSYTFTKSQAACVGVLWAAWKAGTPELDGLTVVTQADVSQTRLIDVFRSKGRAHAAWGTMIMQGQSKGAYRLSDYRRLPRET
jgi:hypothetical protein